MSLNKDIQHMVSKLPKGIKVDPRMIDMGLNNPMTINYLLDKVQTDLGIEAAQDLANLVTMGTIPDNPTVLVTYLAPLKSNPVVYQAIQSLTRSMPCKNCDEPNTYHPKR